MAEDLATSPAPEVAPAEPQINIPQDAPTEEAPPPVRRIKFVDNDIDLPDGLPDEVYTKLEEINGSLNKGVTTKFQQAAELAKQAQAEREAVKAYREEQQALIKTNRKIAAIEDWLEPYENITPDQYDQAINSAPDESTRQRIRDIRQSVSENRQRLQSLKTEAQAKVQQEAQSRQQTETQWTQYGTQVLQSAIKDWGPQKLETVLKTMREYGVGATTPELDRVALYAANYHPAIIRAFHDAALYQQLKSKAVSAPAPSADAAEPPAPAQPVQKVGAQARVAKDPDKMSMQEWLKWRNAQLKQARAA